MISTKRPVTARSQVTGFNVWSVIAIVLLPGILFAADLIDKTKPASIPSEIVAAWKEQDKVSGSNYSTAINNIIDKLKELGKNEYADLVKSEASKGDENAYLTACHYRRLLSWKIMHQR
jgi:hypothetical protein